MAKYRKRPVVIDAWQWDGTRESVEDVDTPPLPPWLSEALDNGNVALRHVGQSLIWLDVWTPEGRMKAGDGDWIIRGVKGELYPCKPDIFAMTYEAVSDEPAGREE